MKWAEWVLSVLLIVVLVISCSNISSAHAGIKVYADAKTSDDYITSIETIDKKHVIIVRNWK